MTDAEKFAQNFVRQQPVKPELKEGVQTMVTKVVSHPAYGNPDYKWSMDDFELGNRLGRGKFGRVYVARMPKTGMIVALKTLFKKEIVNGRVERQILREIEIQSHLKHPNVLQMYTWFHDSFRIYLVLEFAGNGELYGHLKKAPGGRFNSQQSAKYTYQVADALNYCHENQVIHRDIKPENLLLTINGDVKLADFGWSVHAPSLRRKTMCGTLDYLAPELIENREYGKYIDHWCLGVLCYEFLNGFPPFESATTDQTYSKIKHVQITFADHMDPGAINLIKSLLIHNVEKRSSLLDVMRHPWIMEHKDKV